MTSKSVRPVGMLVDQILVVRVRYWVVVLWQVDVHTLKFFYMEDDGGGLLMSRVHRDIKAAVIKVTYLLFVQVSYTSEN